MTKPCGVLIHGQRPSLERIGGRTSICFRFIFFADETLFCVRSNLDAASLSLPPEPSATCLACWPSPNPNAVSLFSPPDALGESAPLQSPAHGTSLTQIERCSYRNHGFHTAHPSCNSKVLGLNSVRTFRRTFKTCNTRFPTRARIT